MEVTTRTIQTEAPYIMRVDVPFTGTDGESVTVYTSAPLSTGRDRQSAVSDTVEILGMMTDITGATGLFTRNGDGIWSSDQQPLALNFGKPGSTKPVQWLERPLSLSRGQRVRADLINEAGVGAGTLYFICRQKRDQPRVSIPSDLGEPDSITIESGLTGVADERPERAASPVLEEDFLVYGVHTNMNNATMRIFGVDGIPWSDDFVNVWALAGRAADQLPVMRLHQPYLIEAQHKVTAEFVNGSGADVDELGQLYLKGLRFPSVRS